MHAALPQPPLRLLRQPVRLLASAALAAALAVVAWPAAGSRTSIVSPAVAATDSVEESKACRRVAKKLTKRRAFRGLDGARRLRTLLKRDPTCRAAPRAAYDHLVSHWDKLVPNSTASSTVQSEWARFKSTAAFAQAIVAFRSAPVRPQAALALGGLYEAMAVFLQERGGAPEDMMVIRDVPESLYHTRAVDLAEYLLIQAETSLDLVTRLLADRGPTDETLRAATQRLERIRGRYAARAEEAAARRAAREAEAAAEGRGEGATDAPPPSAR